MRSLTYYIIKNFTYYVEVQQDNHYKSIMQYNKSVRIYGYDFDFNIDFNEYYTLDIKSNWFMLDYKLMFKLYKFIYKIKSIDLSTIFIKHFISPYNNLSEINRYIIRNNVFKSNDEEIYFNKIRRYNHHIDKNEYYKDLFNNYAESLASEAF